MPGGFNAPLDVIASWPTPNYTNPVTRPKYVLIFSAVIGPISIALLCARLWVRIRMQHNDGWDDWLMLAAALPMLVLTVIFPLVTEVFRFDRHVWDVEYTYFPIQRKFVMAIYILYSLTSGLIKLSILLFYRRLSSRTLSPAFRWIVRITIFVVGAYSVAFMVIPIFMCTPVSAFWDQVDLSKIARGYKYTCINEGMDVVAHGTISTFQDLVVAFIPTLLCWNLQIPRRQKIALYVIFALGYTSVAIGAMRTYQGYRLFFTTYDVTWVASDIWLWSLLELHIGSMCANAPALRIFLEKVLKVEKLASWKRSRLHSNSDGSKKQDLGKTNVIASTNSEQRKWYDKPFISDRRDSIVDARRSIFSRCSTAVQQTDRPNTHDSMTKPFASEYVDTIVEYNSGAHNIEMGVIPIRHFPDKMRANPFHQTSDLVGHGGGRPPPLSQVRTSWNTDGQRYVGKPWAMDTTMKAASEWA